jgi:hypothetical protein
MILWLKNPHPQGFHRLQQPPPSDVLNLKNFLLGNPLGPEPEYGVLGMCPEFNRFQAVVGQGLLWNAVENY